MLNLNPQSAFVEVIKIKWGYKNEAVIWQNQCPYRDIKSELSLSLSKHMHQGKAV